MDIYVNNVRINLKDRIPHEWKQKDNAQAFVYAYKVFGVKKDNIDNLLKEFSIGDAVILLFHGKFEYVSPREKLHKIEDNNLKFIEPEVLSAAENAYLFLITLNEDKNIVNSMLGLLNAFWGRNITCEYMFNNMIFINEKDTGSITSYPLVNYSKLPIPDISDVKLKNIGHAFDNILSKKNRQMRKIIFSLSWFFEAMNSEEDNRNIFLKNWIAIETLSMNSTSRYSIGVLLGGIYSLDANLALNYFQIKQVYKIRCKIVHEGKLINVDYKILSYLQDLYVDLLFYKIGVPSELRSKKHIDNGLDIFSYLK